MTQFIEQTPGCDCGIVTSEYMWDSLDLLADFENEKIAVYTRKMRARAG
jgi:hypothetical protein